ncbi:MAG TPA: type II toxin-antitoxin system RelE/ParE family toxin [Flavobacteriales bacterium]|nr:type II toxin-antitoxin system RelE/ParE family toxin [Flavobacteriales bacterium]
MSMEVEWRDRAIHETQDAYDWYEARSKGTGERFIAELDEHIAFMQKRPKGYPLWRYRFRKVTMLVFPYKIIYRVEGERIIIFSVFHNKRDPQRWGRPH